LPGLPHLLTLWGWLLPGPVSAAPAPPWRTAIFAAVCPFPYFFETSPWTLAAATVFAVVGVHVAASFEPPAVHRVRWDVVLLGFTPASADVVSLAPTEARTAFLA
jgi:hypothetical protein